MVAFITRDTKPKEISPNKDLDVMKRNREKWNCWQSPRIDPEHWVRVRVRVRVRTQDIATSALLLSQNNFAS